MRSDPRVVLPALAAWIAAWTAVGSPGWAAGGAVGLGAFVLSVLAILSLRRVRAPVTNRAEPLLAIAALCLAAAALVCTAVAAAAPVRMPDVLDRAAGRHTTITAGAVVTSAPVAASDVRGSERRIRVEVRIESVRGVADARVIGLRAPALVFAESTAGRLAVGAAVTVRGGVEATDPGESVAYLLFADGPLTIDAPPPPVLGWADPLRAAFRASAATLPGDGGDLLPGLAIGDTGAVKADLDAAMKHASLSHLTAVSGANCAVVVAAIMLLGAAIGLPRIARIAAALTALAGFVVLVTPEPSVLRAALMAVIVLAAIGAGRPGRGVAALSVAVIALLAVDPWLARSYGLALSVAATAGLLLLAGPLARRLARWMPLPVAVAVAVPLAAQLSCQPILVLLDPTLPIGGVAANLLAEPAAPLATVLGLLGCLLLGALPGPASLCIQLAWLPAAWIAQVARTLDALPALRLPWLGGALGATSTAVVTAAALWLVLRRPGGANRRLVVLAVAFLLVVSGCYGGSIVAGSVVRAVSMPADWRYAACDIGQGDAILVRDGGEVALIDVGPDPAPLAKCLDTLGIRRIDLLVLTHYDLDHVGGVDAVVGRVDDAVVGLPVDEVDARIVARLQAGGAVVRRGTAGLVGRLGDLDWRVLWPSADATTMRTGNAGSVTLLVTGRGSSAVFLGDLGEDAQDALLAASHPGPVDVVKVAHHGSADQSERLYDELHAAVGLISVGVDNGYGHPTGRLLGILARTGTTAVRTDRQGLILVEQRADGVLRVWSQRPDG